MALGVILVRHAETDWSKERRYQGWTDRPLSPRGREQALAVARALADAPLTTVYSSPLQRARETALAIAEPHRLAVREAPAFNEMGLGRWEGLTFEEAQALDPDLYQAWLDTPHLVSPPGGESLAAVKNRVLTGLEDLRERHDGESVCMVTHAIAARLLILEALGLPLDRLWSVHVSATGISELEFRDDWSALHRMNTLVHLGPLPEPR